MPDLPTDPVDLETTIRAAIASELALADESLPVDLQPRVWTRPRFVNSEAEWLQIAAIRHPQAIQQGGMETRVVFLELQDLKEVDEGICFHTLLTLQYGVDVMFGLVDKRKDGSNSHDDFVAYLMRARARFQQNRSFGYPRGLIEHKLLQTARKARVEKIDFAIVHRWEGSLEVVIDITA
jgi:hypothetical protein